MGSDLGKSHDLRRRTAIPLFVGVALTNTTMVGASTIGTLIAAETIGPLWSGVPNAAGVLGTAAGTMWLPRLIARSGTRAALVIGYLITAIGAIVAVASVVQHQLLLLTASMLLIGIGNGGCQLSRYIAAEPYPPQRRGAVLAMVLWAGTIGALIGPNLIGVSANAAPGFGLPANSGPYVLSLLTACGAAAASALIPRRRPAEEPRSSRTAQARRVSRRPVVWIGMTAMAAAQIAMVAVMTMTPLQMQDAGQGLTAMGAVMTVHMVGMFALAPISGVLASRFGGNVTILAGIATILASMVCVIALPSGSGPMPYVAMFLLGYGWNLTFVGGSAVLSSNLPEHGRIRVEGTVDTVVWICSAVASAAAGAVMAGPGYAALAGIAGVTMLVPVLLIIRHRGRRSTPDQQRDGIAGQQLVHQGGTVGEGRCGE